VVDKIRVLIVAGIAAGVVMIGLGSRAAMLILRLTSPARVHGVESDDGFTIGEVTLGGTYNLMMLGAAIGIIGAGTYLMVCRWLIGPLWFRRATTGLAAAVVGGSMLVHSDGIDFNVLEPKWLAISLFVLLPGVFGTFIGSFVDAVNRSESWTRVGTRRWVLPLICIACFPLSIVTLMLSIIVLLACVVVDISGGARLLRKIPAYGVIVRAAWMTIAAVGLVALIGDIVSLA
jgi:hypothetical protein